MKQMLLSFALIALPSAALASAPIEGKWQNPKDSVIVDVRPCGAATWCGKVTWASPKAKRKAAGRLGVGTQLLTGLKADGRGGYRGQAYVPNRRIRATAFVSHAGPNALIVKGCALGGLLCKSQRWTRVR
jgi:uncharacterized protein (DUF2147 family)